MRPIDIESLGLHQSSVNASSVKKNLTQAPEEQPHPKAKSEELVHLLTVVKNTSFTDFVEVADKVSYYKDKIAAGEYELDMDRLAQELVIELEIN